MSVQLPLNLLRISRPVLLLAVAGAAFAQEPQIDPKHLEEIKKDVDKGKEYSAELEKDLVLSEDAKLLERVRRIGGELAAIANKKAFPATYGDARLSPFEYEFKVVVDKDVNAFSVPGGFIYINTGLLDNVESDAELAGVLAHEIAHASHRHLMTLAKEYSKVSTLTTIAALVVAVFADGRDAVNTLNTQQLFLMALTSGWSEKAELDADQAGLRYMMESKYNPVGILTFMERLAFKESRLGPNIDWGIQRTHPPSRKRVVELRNRLTANDIPIARSQVTTSFRVAVKEAGDRRALSFGGSSLFTVGGNDAAERAETLAERLNKFFDSSPQIFSVRVDEGRLLWFGRELVQFRDDDIEGKSASAAAETALAAIKSALFSLDFRTGG